MRTDEQHVLESALIIWQQRLEEAEGRYEVGDTLLIQECDWHIDEILSLLMEAGDPEEAPPVYDLEDGPPIGAKYLGGF